MKRFAANGLHVRDAAPEDLPSLLKLKDSEALHRDRVEETAATPNFRYLVLQKGKEIIGFACLVFVRPASWSDATDTSRLPQIVDLVVSPQWRGRGYGSFFIGEIERMVVEKGMKFLYITVDFPDNERAHALYLRLGYQRLQSEPYPVHWELTDSDGRFHHGDSQVVDMRKSF